MGNQDNSVIPETIEEQELQNKLKLERQEKEQQEKEHIREFDEKVVKDLDNLLEKVGEDLVSKKEKKSITSKVKSIYLMERSKGQNFNLKESLKKVIKTSSFEKAGSPGDNKSFEEYNKKINEIRSQILDKVFGGKTENNSGENKKSLTNKEKLDKKESLSEDSPYFPILDTLRKDGSINLESFQKVSLKLNKIDNTEGKEKAFLVFINSLDDKNLKKSIFKSFDSKNEIREENFTKTDFFADSKDLELDINNGVGDLEIVLAKNYVSLPDNEGKTDKNRDLKVCMNVTLNSIIVKNSVDFREQNAELIDKIRTEKNLKSKYNLLKELYKNDLRNDAKYGKKSKETLRLSKEQKEKIIQKIQEKIKKIRDPEIRKLIMKKPPEDLSKIPNLPSDIKKILQEIKELKEELDSGDVFEGGEVDKTPEKIVETKEQS